jgi:hypothetical protein
MSSWVCPLLKIVNKVFGAVGYLNYDVDRLDSLNEI